MGLPQRSGRADCRTERTVRNRKEKRFNALLDKRMIHCYNKKTERTLFLEKKVEVGCMRKQVYSLLVDNTPGVLSRIAGLFSRRGFSIDSITAGVTADPRFTRITVVASGDERILSQIEKQVRKLEDVLEIKLLNDEEAVYRELILVKIKADATLRPGIIAIADVFRAKIIDVEKESLIIELTGAQSKLDAFLNLLDGYEILELARTGITGLSRGNKDIADAEEILRKRAEENGLD